MAFPAANAAWAEDRIFRFARADIGVAVAVEGGLFTPVVRSADSKSLSAIAAEIRDLADRARNRKLEPHEYQGGSAAVSNLGMYGVRSEEHTSELQSLMRISYAVFCLKKK